MPKDCLGKYLFLGAFITRLGTNYAIYANQDDSFYIPICISSHQMEVLSKLQEGGIEQCGIYSTLFSLLLSCGVKIAEIDIRKIDREDKIVVDSVLTLSDPNSNGVPFTLPLSLSDGVMMSIMSSLPMYLVAGSEKMAIVLDQEKTMDTNLLLYIAEEVGACEYYLNALKETFIAEKESKVL